MKRLTKRVDGIAILESWAVDRDPVSIIQRLCAAIAAYEDTGLEPEEIKDFMAKWEYAVELAGMCKENGVDHLHNLLQAKKDGLLVVLDEKVALSMCAGARAIENNKRLFGVTYGYDIFGVRGGPKEISYYDAAKKLREIAEPVLDREEAALAGKGGDEE